MKNKFTGKKHYPAQAMRNSADTTDILSPTPMASTLPEVGVPINDFVNVNTVEEEVTKSPSEEQAQALAHQELGTIEDDPNKKISMSATKLENANPLADEAHHPEITDHPPLTEEAPLTTTLDSTIQQEQGEASLSLKISPENTASKFTTKSQATESDIANVQPMTILNFGHGVHLRVSKNGVKTFLLRYCVGGENSTISLGTFPEMRFVQALAKAEIIQAEVNLARSKKSMSGFKARIREIEKKPAIKTQTSKYKTFQSIADARQFFHRLTQRQNGVPDEIRLAITLLLLIPSKPNTLLEAHRADFNEIGPPTNPGVNIWVIKPIHMTADGRRTPPQTAYLSSAARNVLNELFKPTWSNVGIRDVNYPLFPGLVKMSKIDRANEIAKALHTIWPSYTIDPQGLRYFFKAQAYDHSHFKTEFIDAMMAHNTGSDGDNIFIKGMFSIADWWNDFLQVNG